MDPISTKVVEEIEQCSPIVKWTRRTDPESQVRESAFSPGLMINEEESVKGRSYIPQNDLFVSTTCQLSSFLSENGPNSTRLRLIRVYNNMAPLSLPPCNKQHFVHPPRLPISSPPPLPSGYNFNDNIQVFVPKTLPDSLIQNPLIPIPEALTGFGKPSLQLRKCFGDDVLYSKFPTTSIASDCTIKIERKSEKLFRHGERDFVKHRQKFEKILNDLQTTWATADPFNLPCEKENKLLFHKDIIDTTEKDFSRLYFSDSSPADSLNIIDKSHGTLPNFTLPRTQSLPAILSKSANELIILTRPYCIPFKEYSTSDCLTLANDNNPQHTDNETNKNFQNENKEEEKKDNHINVSPKNIIDMTDLTNNAQIHVQENKRITIEDKLLKEKLLLKRKRLEILSRMEKFNYSTDFKSTVIHSRPLAEPASCLSARLKHTPRNITKPIQYQRRLIDKLSIKPYSTTQLNNCSIRLRNNQISRQYDDSTQSNNNLKKSVPLPQKVKNTTRPPMKSIKIVKPKLQTRLPSFSKRSSFSTTHSFTRHWDYSSRSTSAASTPQLCPRSPPRKDIMKEVRRAMASASCQMSK